MLCNIVKLCYVSYYKINKILQPKLELRGRSLSLSSKKHNNKHYLLISPALKGISRKKEITEDVKENECMAAAVVSCKTDLKKSV